jgi:ribosomal 50S subunit-recycling heat shock protein
MKIGDTIKIKKDNKTVTVRILNINNSIIEVIDKNGSVYKINESNIIKK